MGRRPCCSKEENLNRGAWTAAEDKILTDYVKIHGEGKWRDLPKRAGLKRCGKSCRLRWLNYLRPDIKRGNISHDEKELIIRLHNLLGNRWSLIAGRLPGRTDNEIKNYWNTKIGKKLKDQQIPSSSTRNILNHQCQEKLKLGSGKSIADKDFYPIRTRASKCNKVFFSTPEPKKCDDQDQVIDTKQTMANDQNGKGAGSLPSPEFNLEDNDSTDLIVDFEMDEHFLNFLNTEFSQLPRYDGISITNTCDNLLSDNMLQDSDFALMDELFGSELI